MKYGYARVRSEIQNIEPQIKALLKSGVKKGNLFIDISSGAKAERKGFVSLISEIKEGDTLYVWKVDRIARNVSHFSKLIEHFECEGIKFKSIQEPFVDTTISHCINLSSFFNLIRQLEKDLQIEVTKAGLEKQG